MISEKLFSQLDKDKSKKNKKVQRNRTFREILFGMKVKHKDKELGMGKEKHKDKELGMGKEKQKERTKEKKVKERKGRFMVDYFTLADWFENLDLLGAVMKW